ncbi:uridylate kinase [uncultured Methylobacterium sp.]|uniref:amino acid kinase family protein n=1 Tax=uncultured Methylobacterium sp. TaxID=157278 RepID=UPI0035CB1FDE
MSPLSVVKVGGSLCADPGRLAGLLAALAEGVHGRCVIVPGGGAFADAVRTAQAREGFDDAVAHRLALDAMARMAASFREIEPRLVRCAALSLPRRGGRESAGGVLENEALVWDPTPLKAGHPDIPETWDVTSDSLALWLAAAVGAGRCVLVKSTDAPSGRSPAELARLGLVDAAFPAFAAAYAGAIEVWGPDGAVRLAHRIAA